MKAAAQELLPRFDAHWRPHQLTGRKVLLLGLGSFGGGIGAARWLLQQDVELIITDLRDEASLGAVVGELREAGARLVLGRHDEADLEGCACVVASPAVPPSAPFLRAAAQRGIPVESEITLLARRIPCPWIGVTGTNGKSTTAALIAGALRTRFERVHEGGNMGGSLLGEVGRWSEEDRAVLELSSFQLEHLAATGQGPDVAVLTNLSPDHLDRHGSMPRYEEAKRGILRRARIAVLPADDSRMRRWAEGFDGEVWWFSNDAAAERPAFSLDETTWRMQRDDGPATVASCAGFPLPGPHNRRNLLAAAAAAVAFGAAFEEAVRSGGSAAALRSRLEPLDTIGGVRFVDDGVCTSPEAVLAALRAFDGAIHLLIGGYDKGLDPSPVVEEVTKRGIRTYLFGDVARVLADRLRRASSGRGPRQDDVLPVECVDLPAAFEAAVRTARAGELVLFSPGHASYDQFRNFTERVELFRSLVGAWRDLQSTNGGRGEGPDEAGAEGEPIKSLSPGADEPYRGR